MFVLIITKTEIQWDRIKLFSSFCFDLHTSTIFAPTAKTVPESKFIDWCDNGPNLYLFWALNLEKYFIDVNWTNCTSKN